ncbi:MAG: type II secretion system F family protein [Candidatus Sumerlaeia bacterium]|nr:type II secretion system F family protein [Candidatus Sumerlaeia bacterium]
MPTFVYKAKDKKGAPVEGSMEAEGRAAVVTRLQQMGYFPVSINQGVKRGGKVVSAGTSGGAKKGGSSAKGKEAPKASTEDSGQSFTEWWSSRRGITASDLAGFNRQLADLLGAGIPLVKGLAILNKQTTNEKLREVIFSILDDVQGGATFADALAKHPKVFSKLYVAMVRSGEAGGMLDDVLQRLADFSEQEEQTRGKIKSALAYPVVMVIAGSIAVFVMFSFIIPRITATFEQLNQALPAITQLLITMSDATQEYWLIGLVVIAVAIVVVWQFLQSTEGRLMWHRTQLSLPLMGPLVQKSEVARFARTLGSLLRNGVSILVALEIVKEVLNNQIVRGEVEKVVEEITQGSGVAAPLKNSKVFPPIAVNMIAIGEETGRLPEVLLRVSESFEGQVERSVRTLTSLLEPIIIVIMGAVVAFIVIAMLLPIFSLDPSGGM